MFKRKFLVLIIAIISSVATLFSGVGIVNGAETNNLINGAGASVVASGNVFDSSYTLTVEENTSPSEISNASALIYGNQNVYQKVAIGYTVKVFNGLEELPSKLSCSATVSIPVNYPSATPVQVINFNENYSCEVYTAVIDENKNLKFSASTLGEFWLLINTPSSLSTLDVFERSRILTSNVQNQGGFVSNENYLTYINVTKPGLTVAKTFADDVMASNQTAFNDMLRLYKLASERILDTYYDKNDYSVTENGIYAINAIKTATLVEINSAINIDEVDLAVKNFKTQIETGNFSKKLATVSSSGDVKASVTAYKYDSDNLVEYLAFSNDTAFTLNEVKDGILVKNTNLALLNDERVVTDGGVYKYLNVMVAENGVNDQKTYDKLTVAISLESIGLTNGDASGLQVAKYIKNRQVDIIAVTVVDGNLVFDITEFGSYAIVKEGCAIENTSEFLAFINNYGLIVGIVLAVIIILIIVISVAKGKKKRREKREFKEFKKSQKQNGKKDKKATKAINTRKR